MNYVDNWLMDADRVAGLGRRLRAASIPLDRLALYRRTLHPEILARATAWAPGRPVELFDREHGLDLSVRFSGSPLCLAMVDGETHILAAESFDGSAWNWADPFRGLGLKTILIRPLAHDVAFVLGTQCAQGFSKQDLDLVNRLLEGSKRKRNTKPS